MGEKQFEVSLLTYVTGHYDSLFAADCPYILRTYESLTGVRETSQHGTGVATGDS